MAAEPGYLAFGGGSLYPRTEKQCLAFARSIMTMPVDWSSSANPETIGKTHPFYRRAADAAGRGESVGFYDADDGHSAKAAR